MIRGGQKVAAILTATNRKKLPYIDVHGRVAAISANDRPEFIYPQTIPRNIHFDQAARVALTDRAQAGWDQK
jgi:type II secretory pathway component PulK